MPKLLLSRQSDVVPPVLSLACGVACLLLCRRLGSVAWPLKAQAEPGSIGAEDPRTPRVG